jgi:hypothetical protein
MRLLHTDTLKLRAFEWVSASDGSNVAGLSSLREEDAPEGSAVPPYAILSHRWTPPGDQHGEVTYQQLSTDQFSKDSRSWQKIKAACRIALKHEIYWIWVDTCCIDKSNSVELSESINSMFEWYSKAEVCYAFLDSVAAPATMNGSPSAEGDFYRYRKDPWFTRGWTLQELLAPTEMYFYHRDGPDHETYLGRRHELAQQISSITRIDAQYLADPDRDHGVSRAAKIRSASVAQRLSWAAHRETKKPEDIAYCLLGILDVNMPLLYGEGKERAFMRLQIRVIDHQNDDSIFAWGAGDDTFVDRDDIYLAGMLARSPSDFNFNSGTVLPGSCPGMAPPQASMISVQHTSKMSPLSALGACYWQAHLPLHNELRLGCIYIDRNGRRCALWIQLRRAKDGSLYRAGLRTIPIRGLHRIKIAVMDFTNIPNTRTVSSTEARKNNRPMDDSWASWFGRLSWKGIVTARNVTTFVVFLVGIGIFGPGKCSAGSACDIAILVSVLAFALHDLAFNKVYFWTMVILWVFIALLTGSGSIGTQPIDNPERPVPRPPATFQAPLR